MKKSIERFNRRKTGAALVEYVVLTGLIGVLSIGMVLSTGESVRDIFGTAETSIASHMSNEDDLSTETAATEPDTDDCYAATSGDYYDAGYDCFVIDASENFYADYASETSDDITIYMENPNKPSVSGWAPEIELENGTVVWTDAGPHGQMSIYGEDDDGNISIEFPDLTCSNLDFIQEYGVNYIEVTDTGTSRIWFDSSIDTVSCGDGSGGVMVINEPYDTIIVPNYGGDTGSGDLGMSSSSYTVMDTQIYDELFTVVWEGPNSGIWPDLPFDVSWKIEDLSGEYCLYDNSVGEYLSDMLCYPESTLTAAGMSGSIDDTPAL